MNVLSAILNNRVDPLFRKILYENLNRKFVLENVISEDTVIASNITFRNLMDDFKLIHTDKIRKTLKNMNLKISEDDLNYIEESAKKAVNQCKEVHKGITKTLNIQKGFKNMNILCGCMLNPNETKQQIIDKFKIHLLNGVNFYLDDPNEIYGMYEETRAIDINKIKDGLTALINHYLYGVGESLSDAITFEYIMGDHIGFDLHKYDKTVFEKKKVTKLGFVCLR